MPPPSAGTGIREGAGGGSPLGAVCDSLPSPGRRPEGESAAAVPPAPAPRPGLHQLPAAPAPPSPPPPSSPSPPRGALPAPLAPPGGALPEVGRVGRAAARAPGPSLLTRGPATGEGTGAAWVTFPPGLLNHGGGHISPAHASWPRPRPITPGAAVSPSPTELGVGGGEGGGVASPRQSRLRGFPAVSPRGAAAFHFLFGLGRISPGFPPRGGGRRDGDSWAARQPDWGVLGPLGRAASRPPGGGMKEGWTSHPSFPRYYCFFCSRYYYRCYYVIFKGVGMSHTAGGGDTGTGQVASGTGALCAKVRGTGRQ